MGRTRATHARELCANAMLVSLKITSPKKTSSIQAFIYSGRPMTAEIFGSQKAIVQLALEVHSLRCVATTMLEQMLEFCSMEKIDIAVQMEELSLIQLLAMNNQPIHMLY